MLGVAFVDRRLGVSCLDRPLSGTSLLLLLAAAAAAVAPGAGNRSCPSTGSRRRIVWTPERCSRTAFCWTNQRFLFSAPLTHPRPGFRRRSFLRFSAFRGFYRRPNVILHPSYIRRFHLYTPLSFFILFIFYAIFKICKVLYNVYDFSLCFYIFYTFIGFLFFKKQFFLLIKAFLSYKLSTFTNKMDTLKLISFRFTRWGLIFKWYASRITQKPLVSNELLWKRPLILRVRLDRQTDQIFVCHFYFKLDTFQFKPFIF